MAFIFAAMGAWCGAGIILSALWHRARKAQGPNRRPERHLRVVK